MQEMVRITALFTELADPSSDGEQKLAKLNTITPTEFYKYIAIAAGERNQYG